MGLWTLLEGLLLVANGLAILNEDRFLGPRGWSFSEFSSGGGGSRAKSFKGQLIGLIYATQSKSNQYPNTSLIQIEGVNTKEDVAWYAGKRMAYIYKAKTKKKGSLYRCIWGKVIRPHGNSAVVRAKFKSNLPPKSMGARVRVFMYPSNI